MNDWRALGYVPDSEGEDENDILLSPPRTVEANAEAGTRLPGDITNEGAKEGGKQDALDIFDLPSSSVENGGIFEGRRRGRGRPPKRWGAAKRLSVGGSQRPKKQARVEGPAGRIEKSDLPSTPTGRIGRIGGDSSPYPSSGNRSAVNLFSVKGDGDTTLDTNFETTSPSRVTLSIAGAPVSNPYTLLQQVGEDDLEEVDLIDEHGPDSDIEDAPAQPIMPSVVPPSSPPVRPQVLSAGLAIDSPALPSRSLLIESGANSPAPPTPRSISSNVEMRIPFSHTGLTDPATRINIDSATTNSDDPIIPPDDFTSGVARNLRARKPIQMNPYQLELERYNSDWKSRGLKPVRYVYNDPMLPSNKKTTEKDSQADEWIIPEGDEDTQAATLQQTQSFRSTEQDSMDVGGQEDLHDDEELLALDELFRRSSKERPTSLGERRTSKGGKRRKTGDPPRLSAKSRRIIESAKAILDRGNNLGAASGETAPNMGQDPASSTRLPKTPVAHNKKSHHSFDIFDIESSDSELGLLASRAPASTSRRQVILESDESDGGDTTPRAGSPTRRRFSVSSSSTSDLEEEESPNDPEAREVEIQMYQRKVRGVLPASWIRFNQSKAQENKKLANVHHSPEARPMVKGMAQIRIRARNSPPAGSMANPLNLSSSESSDNDDNEVKVVGERSKEHPISSSTRPSAFDSMSTAYSERSYAFEDHGFDRMLSRSRAPNTGTRNKTKLTKPRNLRQPKLFSGSFNKNVSSTSRNPPASSKPRQKTVALSVVDACKLYRKNKSSSPPQFMRVAERLAKKRKDLGRHLPDRKIVQIDPVFEDETDGEDTLMKWKRTKAKDDSAAAISSHKEKILPSSSFQPYQPQPGFGNISSTHGRQPAYFQTKLVEYRLQQEPRPRQNQKPRLKSQVMAKPIALLPPQVHRYRKRMDDILQHLNSVPRTADPIEDDYDVQVAHPPILQPRDTTIHTPQHRSYSSGSILQNDRRTTGGSGGARRVQSGSAALPQQRRGQLKKASIPKRIERNKPPIAFQPPEKRLSNLPDSMDVDASDGKALSFENMKPIGTTYSSDFDVRAARGEKTLFHESTFLGSGALARALETGSGRTYRSGTRVQNVEVMGRLFEWGVYEEAVAEQLESSLASILNTVEQFIGPEDNIGIDRVAAVLAMRKFFRYAVDYLAMGIFFSDLVDVGLFATRFIDILSDFVSKVGSFRIVSDGGLSAIFQMQMFAYAFILVYQVSCIVDKDNTICDQERLHCLHNEISESLISILGSYGTLKLQKGLSAYFQNVFTANELNEEAICLESWIIAYRISLSTKTDMRLRRPSFWEHVNTSICPNAVSTLKDIEVLDSLWREIFRLVTLSAIDSRGKMKALDSDDVRPDNWGFVKELVVQSLTIYNASSLGGRIKSKNYIRALFARCLVFLRDWNWGRPDAIIIPLYDLFGKRLQNLTDEKDPKDPEFLEHLDQPSFSHTPFEMCFSIFLKIVAFGTKRMQLQKSRALGDLVIRITPNHGRVFLKEDNDNWADVDMLANHHYLLTALYYGAGNDFHKRIVGIVKQLVDPKKSHSKVCALNLRAWANILICELAEGKNEGVLKDLMKWHADFVKTTIGLHRDNESRLEEEKKKLFDPNLISKLERDALDNKRNVESVLFSAIGLLKMVFKKDICDFYSAEFVLGTDSLKKIYALAGSLPQSLVANAVEILSFHIKVCQNFGFSPADDSQDSWNGFDGIESEGVRKKAAKKLLDEMYDPVFNLLNTYFAGPGKNLDNVLGPCIQTWVELGSFLVQCGLKTWDEYFNRYQKSWFSMIDTDAKKAYSVIYVANIIRTDPGAYDTHKTQILELWAQCLVERESLLKFQHELTTVLFNLDLGNGLFSNMPFEVDQELEQYRISAHDFKERRLSLLGTLLDNMQREMVVVLDTGDHSKARTVKAEYVSMLQGLMNAMKDNYIAIHASKHPTNKGPDVAILQQKLDDSIASNYVTFCQQVIEYLQQYTVEICAIDKFFVDSVVFPLPKNDPTYVTSKLKGYFLRMKTERKGWIVQFLQFWNNTMGRVAAEKQQEYFVEQILGAFDVGERYMVEQGGGRTPREFCVMVIFGAYVRRCMEGIGNLVVAVPVLGVLEKVVQSLILEFDGLEDSREVDGRISGLLVSVLEPVRVAVEAAVSLREKVLSEPLALHVVEMLARIVGGCDHMVNLLHLRVSHVSEELPQDLMKIAVRGLSRLKACLEGKQMPEQLDLVMFEPNLPFQTERKRFETEYGVEMGKWRVTGRELFVNRAAVKKKIEWDHLMPDVTLVEMKGKLRDSIGKVMELASTGVCEGVVREVEGSTVGVRRPMCKWADELLGIGEREGGFEPETEAFDMDD
ncbi:hypothetical protein TWF718_007559 [Orbilia javanica]|uniref:Mus7/MMS22 family-domain-containing protein n=1 Tax=Orbilia javanica TaxID=47235 RepID=A0AAN8MPH4_9PEZI